MEKYTVAQLEHTSKHTCVLDCDFIAFPMAASAFSTVLRQSQLTQPQSAALPSLLLMVDVPHTSHSQRGHGDSEVKAELKSFMPVEDNPAISSYLVFWAASYPGKQEILACLCLAPSAFPCDPSHVTLLGNMPDLHLTSQQVF